MLFSIAMASIGLAKSWELDATKMLVEPSRIQGNAGDLFWVDINIEKVTDLYAYEFKVGYVPGTRVIGALMAEDGGFLYGPQGTAFTYTVNGIEGYIHVGQTIQGSWNGLSGSGTLARIQFKAGEAGESELHLYDVVLLDHNLDAMPTQTRDGYWDGPNVELVRINIGARTKDVGDTQTFDVKVVNEDTHSQSLTVKGRIDTVRAEDGKTITLWSGQTYQYPPMREPIDLYVDGFTGERTDWTEVGASPFLDAAEDGNYLLGSSDAAQHRWFSFEDFELGDSIIDYVQLEGYTNGPYNEAIDYDIYYTGFSC